MNVTREQLEKHEAEIVVQIKKLQLRLALVRAMLNPVPEEEEEKPELLGEPADEVPTVR